MTRVLTALQVASIVLVATGYALSLAHALEWPGKRRLDEATYRAVQKIYYPGFTAGGAVGEFGAILALLLLVVLTPYGTTTFWLTLAALLSLLVMHALYWVLTHPVNKAWLEGETLGRGGGAFFGTGSVRATGEWTQLRDRWERSHALRAVFALAALVALGTAAAL